jgi:O-antigen ligase
MLYLNLKSLLVVLTVAILVFVAAKPVCLRFMSAPDFARRRNVWLVLTVIAFTSPSIWIFAVLAIPVLAWAGMRDGNPVALYLLMMHIIPAGVGLPIPGVIVNQIFDLDGYRILSIAVLVPAAVRIRAAISRESREFTSMDVLLLAYCALQLVLFSPYESGTNTIRRAILLSIDVVGLYYVVSRLCTSRRLIEDAMASFCLVCAIYAPLAVFEALKGYLLYWGIGVRWGSEIPFAWLFREGVLRAQVSAGHSIMLGYMLAIAFVFWLYLSSRLQSNFVRIVVPVILWGGLIATYARAPWVVGVAGFYAFAALRPRGLIRLVKISIVSALLAGAVLVSPVGERVIDSLPFVGSIGESSVSYREQLAEASWKLFQKNPYFGDPFVLKSLEDLRQGQGIIDLVNTYAGIALFYGLVGLSLFLAFFLVGLRKAYRHANDVEQQDPILSLLGTNLVACMLGTLLMLGTAGLVDSLGQMFWIFGGLAAGYAVARPSHDPVPAKSGGSAASRAP